MDRKIFDKIFRAMNFDRTQEVLEDHIQQSVQQAQPQVNVQAGQGLTSSAHPALHASRAQIEAMMAQQAQHTDIAVLQAMAAQQAQQYIGVSNTPYAQQSGRVDTARRSLADFVAVDVAKYLEAAVGRLTAGRMLHGARGPYNIRAGCDLHAQAWQDDTKVEITAHLQFPDGAGYRASFNFVIQDNDPDALRAVLVDDGAFGPCMAVPHLAAQLALMLQLPESAQKLVRHAAVPTNLDGVQGYRTQVTVNDLEWFEPDYTFPSIALVGRIIALA